MSATTSQFSVRIEHDLREELEEIASAEGRSLGNLVKTLLREILQQRRKATERRK